MELEAINQIAKETELEIPEAYRAFMLAFPEELFDIENEAGEPLADYEFLDDPERIIELNAEVRDDPYYSEEDEEEKDWPASFLVIGENGNGDYHCIDVENDTPIVYFFDHNDGDFIELADDLESFVELLKNGPEVADEPEAVPVLDAADGEEEDED